VGEAEEKHRGRILVVEDEEAVARFLELELREEGYQVRLASSFDQVRAQMAGERFDLVTLDVMMPGVSGLQVLEWLRANHPETGVVMATALGEMEVVIEAMRLGAYSYVLKPFKLELVAHEVARAMERQRLEAENRAYQQQLEQKVADQTRQLERRLAELRRTQEGLEASRAQLRALFLHLQSAREEERKHVAREIHDELGQALTVLKMDASWLQRHLAGKAAPALAKLRAMLELIDGTVRKVQQLSAALRPGLLDDLGLRAALEWQAEEFAQRTGLPCELAFCPEEIALDPDRSLALFRVFQEALTNVYRHARASRVRASLEVREGRAVLEVRDDGRGITPQESASPRALGLIGMRERLYPWGGELEIQGLPRQGTSLRVRLPLAGDGAGRRD
jgi:signal transduction histidine kinase